MDPMPEDQVRLCRLEARVCACASGVNIGIDHFCALMGLEWCEDNQHTAGENDQ